VVDGMVKLLRRVLTAEIVLETRVAPGLPFVHANPGMLEQVLMNLGINARDAMPDGGRIVIGVAAVDVSEPHAALHARQPGGRYLCLSVSDTGRGIPAAHLARIFEPFFTTKEVGKGTGLGLAIVFGIVQEHHGWIEVDSKVGQGTTFRVLLPVIERVVQAAPIAEVRDVPAGHETILLVEDDPAVRATTHSALERLGYRVTSAASAREAIELWQLAQPRVDLVITDLIMPGGASGLQLVKRLRAREPRIKVIYVSGSSPDVVDRLLSQDPGHVWLKKPFAVADLAACVRRRLDEAT